MRMEAGGCMVKGRGTYATDTRVVYSNIVQFNDFLSCHIWAHLPC